MKISSLSTTCKTKSSLGHTAETVSAIERGYGSCCHCSVKFTSSELVLHIQQPPRCHVCYRAWTIRKSAHRDKKTMPSFEWLKSSLTEVRKCRLCDTEMVLLATQATCNNTVTLHHNPNGEHELICMFCNASIRTGRDDYNPRTQFNCTRCDLIFDRAETSCRKSYCVPCYNAAQMEEYYQRKYGT